MSDWSWSERFAGQPEMLRYVRHAADRMDVRRHYSFSTKVVAAVYSDERTMWDVTLDDGRVLTCRSEEHTSELQSLMRISYAVFCLKKKKKILTTHTSKT